MSTERSAVEKPGTTGPSSQVQRRLLAVGAATAATGVAWVLVDPVLGTVLRAEMGADVVRIGLGSVLVTALAVALAGWGLLALLERLTSRGTRIWTVIAVAVALLSLAGPLTGGLTTGAKVGLVVLHAVVAAVLIPLLVRTSRDGAPRR